MESENQSSGESKIFLDLNETDFNTLADKELISIFQTLRKWKEAANIKPETEVELKLDCLA